MTTLPGLTVNTVEVRRMPGALPRFALDGLSTGITIVYGPNGSGKSTTARAIQALLWPTTVTAERGSVRGQFTLNGESWTVDIDTGHVSYQRSATPTSPPDIVAVDGRDRYRLTLHDLLATDDPQFAAHILRESAGGYDLEQAIKELGFHLTSSKFGSIQKELASLDAQIKEKERIGEDLTSTESQLDDLIAKKTSAQAAAARVTLIERALEHKEAEAALEDADRLFTSFAPAFSSLVGNESKAIEAIDSSLHDLQQQKDAEELRAARESQTRAEAGFANAVPNEALVADLRRKALDLHKVESDVSGLARDIEEATAERDAARSHVGDQVASSDLPGIAPDALRAFSHLALRRVDLQARQDAADALEAWFGQSESPGDLEGLRSGIRLLQLQLRAPAAGSASVVERRLRILALAGAALVLIEGGLLARFAHVAFVLFVPVGLVLMALVWRSQSTLVQESPYERDYRALQLPMPSSWSAEHVAILLNQLEEQLRTSEIATEKSKQKLAKRPDRDHLSAGWSEWERDLEETKRQFGMAPTMDAAGLSVLASAVEQWHNADRRLAVVNAQHESLVQSLRERLSSLSEEMTSYGFETAHDVNVAQAQISELDQRRQQFTLADQAVTSAQTILTTTILPQVEQRLAERRALYERIGIPVDEYATLAEMLTQLEDYRTAKQMQTQKEAIANGTRTRLNGFPELLVADTSQLETDLMETRQRASDLEDVIREIENIRTQVDIAKQATGTDVLIASRDDRRQTLREAQEVDYRSSAGALIGNHVRHRTQDLNRPPVFHRAREILARITSGRYLLEFDAQDKPALRATDTTTGVGHALDELSSGTRVQLLMAVRLAFVETVEHGAKLPLLLDETLGNSDELRAREVVNAVMEICRDGRQVFYFTAQHDEVAKWESILQDAPDIPIRTIDLAELRNLAAEQRAPLIETIQSTRPVIPTPAGHSREDYGHLLMVPNIDVWGPDPGGIHLWHLIDDLEELHQLLSRGIGTWGQLRTITSLAGESAVALDSTTLARAKARAKACSAIASLWRIGRGRQVTRLVIKESGAVSATFLDRVVELAERVDGNAESIVAELRSGGISKFHKSAAEALNDYLIEQGFLANEPILMLDDLRLRAQAQLSTEMNQGLILTDELDDFIAQMCFAD